jgi:hypothetical protein
MTNIETVVKKYFLLPEMAFLRRGGAGVWNKGKPLAATGSSTGASPGVTPVPPGLPFTDHKKAKPDSGSELENGFRCRFW